MSYTHTQYEVGATGLSATASGDKWDWTPGYVPHIVRAVGVVITSSGATVSGVQFKFNHLSLVSGAVASAIATLNGPTGAVMAAGGVLYKDGLNVKLQPGQQAIFNVAAAVTGALTVRPFMLVEPTWETPANNAKMVATT